MTRTRSASFRPKGANCHDRIKANGVHYTPPELAAFLAAALLRHACIPATGPVRVVDPACGDGSLLAALAQQAEPPLRRRLELIGYDTDQAALKKASAALAHVAAMDLRRGDFLTLPTSTRPREQSLFDATAEASASPPAPYDLVIANPPYVRTQVLGAEKARQLANDYELSGRVDLYHAFVRAISASLRPGGTLALLTSNRFLYTLAGAATRESLAGDFELCELFDLGDTKLFAAAVLPAIVVARRSADRHANKCPFVRIYELRDTAPPTPTTTAPSILSAVLAGQDGAVTVGSVTFGIERGTLSLPASHKHPWTLSAGHIDGWLDRVKANTSLAFADVGRVRVGIKTTADDVFIRDDWHCLPEYQTPEPELLRPLLRSYMARPWRASAETVNPPRVLYPHAMGDGRRIAVDLAAYPRTRAYLERHRDRLAGRKYVIDGGRQWYEIWVPQNPDDWARPKIVFPDISEQPRFFLDEAQSVVNGDCYWITLLPNQDARWVPLMLAVANSSFIIKYYDAVFGNKLYAGRRRFITQYVERFPLPRLEHPASIEIIPLVHHLLTLPASPEAQRMQRRIDSCVWRAFGSAEEPLR